MTERRSAVRIARGERAICRRRFWEHVICNDWNYAAHVDYRHINPLKHGYLKRVRIGRFPPSIATSKAGLYPVD